MAYLRGAGLRGASFICLSAAHTHARVQGNERKEPSERKSRCCAHMRLFSNMCVKRCLRYRSCLHNYLPKRKQSRRCETTHNNHTRSHTCIYTTVGTTDGTTEVDPRGKMRVGLMLCCAWTIDGACVLVLSESRQQEIKQKKKKPTLTPVVPV